MAKKLSKKTSFTRGVVCRLYPNKEAEEKLWQITGCCRWVWNKLLARRIKRYKKGKINSYSEDSKFLTKIKNKVKYSWLNNVSSISLQQTLRDLNTAYSNFFRRVKKGETPGFPKFKKKFLTRNSFRIVNQKDIRLNFSILNIPKIGEVKLKRSRKFNINNVYSYTMFEKCGKWFVSFTEYFKPKKFKKTGSKIGLDLGVKRLATTSNKKYKKPFKAESLERKIKTKQRELSRKKLRSKRWEKCKHELKKLHLKLKNKRRDYLHKYTTYLVKNHDFIAVEDLKIKNMTKSSKETLFEPGKNVKQKSGLNRSILGQGWFILLNMLDYKCKWYGKKLVKVDPKYTSQTCSVCGYKSRDNRKSQSCFKCCSCGFKINADQNASRNILARGLALN